LTRIPLSSPDVSALEEEYVVEAIRSGWVAPLGPHVDRFEAEVTARIGVGHGVALSSGTAALHLALVSWGVGPGDFVPTSSMTFAASANAITYTGATPVFIDSDPTTGNVDVALLDRAVTELRSAGKSVPAILPIDLLGKCADHTAIAEVARRHGVKILSDAAESLGASHRGRPAGAFGDAAILSFNGNKVMTTSSGGMLLTDDPALADHVRFLSTQAREPAPHYEHQEVGYNYRMSNVLAALGLAQLSRLDGMIARRRAHRERYVELFGSATGVAVFGRDGDGDDNCWLTAVLVNESSAGWGPDALRSALERDDIESRPLWKPMHLQPVYADRPSYVTGASEALFTRGLALPSGSSLTDDEVDHVVSSVEMFLADPLTT
jgi:dTDP-4-amino-4,6-dideoxygalactose transaminase